MIGNCGTSRSPKSQALVVWIYWHYIQALIKFCDWLKRKENPLFVLVYRTEQSGDILNIVPSLKSKEAKWGTARRSHLVPWGWRPCPFQLQSPGSCSSCSSAWERSSACPARSESGFCCHGCKPAQAEPRDRPGTWQWCWTSAGSTTAKEDQLSRFWHRGWTKPVGNPSSKHYLAVHVVLCLNQFPPVDLASVGLTRHNVPLGLVQHFDRHPDGHLASWKSTQLFPLTHIKCRTKNNNKSGCKGCLRRATTGGRGNCNLAPLPRTLESKQMAIKFWSHKPLN